MSSHGFPRSSKRVMLVRALKLTLINFRKFLVLAFQEYVKRSDVEVMKMKLEDARTCLSQKSRKRNISRVMKWKMADARKTHGFLIGHEREMVGIFVRISCRA